MEIPRRVDSTWDGESKLLTSDCSNCDYYREIGRDKVCGWGIAFKVLFEEQKLKRCKILKLNPPIKQSIMFLDDYIATIEKATIDSYKKFIDKYRLVNTSWF